MPVLCERKLKFCYRHILHRFFQNVPASCERSLNFFKGAKRLCPVFGYKRCISLAVITLDVLFPCFLSIQRSYNAVTTFGSLGESL